MAEEGHAHTDLYFLTIPSVATPFGKVATPSVIIYYYLKKTIMMNEKMIS